MLDAGSVDWWCSGVSLDSRLERSRVRVPAFRFQVATLGKLFAHMCLCHQALYVGTGPGAAMPCDWEADCRSDVALAMSRTSVVSHTRAHGEMRTLSTLIVGYCTLLLLCQLLCTSGVL